MEEKKKTLREKIESWVWTIIIILLLRAFVVQAYVIPSGSMEDTLLPGDFLLVTKFDYGIEIPYTGIKAIKWGGIHRGDIVIFRYPFDGRDFVKRIVALPGDTVKIRNKVVYINGKALKEPYAVHKDPVIFPLPHDVDTSLQVMQRLWLSHRFMSGLNFIRDNFGPVVVPDGYVFVMGDNRDFSYDSRFWGPLPIDNLKGKPLIIYFSWNGDGPFWQVWNRIRWRRLLNIVRYW